MSVIARRVTLALISVMFTPLAAAERVQIPIVLDGPFLESMLREEVFNRPGQSVRIADDGTGCQFLELREPRVRLTGGRATVRSRASARVGRKVNAQCLLLVNWHGEIEIDQVPVLGDDGRVALLRAAGWRAYRPDGRPDNLANTLGQWLDRYLPADLKETRISFAGPITALDDLLAAWVARDAAGQASMLVRGVSVSDVAVAADQLTVTLALDAAMGAASPTGSAEPTLSGAELARLSALLDDVDAFFTYTIRSIEPGGAADEPGNLLETLVGLRRELVQILAEPQRRTGDPARRLFLDAWAGLVPYLELAARRSDQAAALRYLTFISAGDALEALDDLGPAAGVEVSSDGLRRLARILMPDDPADPLQRDDGVDPALRRSLGFGPPLPPPQFAIETSWLDWLIPKAMAAAGLNPSLAKRLNSWVPLRKDVNDYLPMVRDVLSYVVAEQLRANPLDGEFHQVYQQLVLTTAWQESCWRQFVAKNDKRVPMESGTGDVGMMQINPKVWRGLYDLYGLRWDIVYNARAGADILQHHLVRYAIDKGEHRHTGSLDSLARAAYAAYNGGPRQYDRYRRADATAQARKVDDLFLEKYRGVKSRGALAVAACYGG